MKTRKRRQQEQEIVAKKNVKLKLKINKFINPSNIFRIFNNFFISEEYFHKKITKYVPHQAFFEFNRIVRGKVVGDLIKFTVIQIGRQFEIDFNYLIERFLSFGDSNFKTLALALSHLRDLRKQIPEVVNEFFKLEDIIKRFDTKKPMIIMHDDPQHNQLSSAPGQLYVSLSLMNKNGWTNPQEYILECVRRGDLCLPFLVNAQNGDSYFDRIIAKIQSLSTAINAAMQMNALKNNEAQNPQIIQPYHKRLEISQRHTCHNELIKVQFVQTPFVHCLQYIEQIKQPLQEFQLNNIRNGLLDEEQYDLLQKLIPVSQNKLKRFEDRVCTFRELPKSILAKNE